MRTVVALVACVLAVCQVKADAVHGGFAEGKRYVYEYGARVGTGSNDQVHQFSGFGVKSTIWAQRDGNKVTFKFNDAKIGQYNKPLTNMKDEVEIQYSHPNGLEKLEQPFVVEFANGVVKTIQVPGTDDLEVRNNKKALATLFQLDLRREGIPDLHLYPTTEDGIGGKCLTYYSVGHHPEHNTDQEVVNVTKIRHYDKCDYYPHLFYSSLQGYECTHCEQGNFLPLKNLAQVHYHLLGNREKYTIEYIYATGAMTITPFSTNGQTVVSLVNQTLHLVEVVDAQPIAAAKVAMESYDSLHYVFQNDKHDHKTVDLTKAHYYDRVHERDTKDRITKAETLLKELEEEFSHEDTSSESKFVAYFIDVFSTFDYSDFETFYGKHVLVSEPHSAQFFLLDILPLVGTNPAIKFSLDQIEKEKIDNLQAIKIIQKIPFYVKEPSKTLVDYARKFGGHDHVKGVRTLYISSRLAYGTLLYKACVSDPFNPHPHDAKQYIDDCSSYIEELIKKYEGAKDDASKSVYVAAIGNTQTKQGLDFLIGVVKSKAHNLIKQRAIVRLIDEFDDETNQKVASALAPIYTDPDEDYVLRIYAFEALLYTNPTPTFFGCVVTTYREDHSQKLKSYMYAALLAYSNTTDPCYKDYKQYARFALQYIEHYQRDVITDSISRQFNVFNPKYNYGRTTHFATVASDDSVLPREIYMGQSVNLMGYNFDVMEFGYSSEGQSFHEEALRAIGLAPQGLFGPGGSREVKNELVKNTVDKFKFERGYAKKPAQYETYFRVLNQDVYLSRDIAADFRAKAESKEVEITAEGIKLDINNIHFMGVELNLPNEIGMVVTFKVRVPVTGHIHGNVKYDVKFNEVNGLKEFGGLTLKPDVHIGLDSTVYSKVAVRSVLYGDLGYALKTQAGLHIPVHADIEYNFQDRKTKITHHTSADPYDVIYYKSVPMTVNGQTREKIHYTDHPIHKEYKCGHDYLGVGLTYNFTYDYYWNDYGSYRHFFKSFFKKDSSYEDYFYLSDKWYAGTRNFLDYAILNPTAKPFYFNARYSRSETNPTTEFIYETEKSKKKDYDFSKNVGTIGFDSKCKLTAKGSVERHWEAEFHADVQWPYRDVGNVKFHWKRGPIPNYDPNPFEVCYDAHATVSDYTKIYALQPVDVKVKYQGQLDLGKTCGDDAKHITIKAEFEKSDEQKAVDKNTLPIYKKCQELAKKGFYFNEYCWKYILDLGRVDKLTVDIDHKNLPVKAKGFFYRVYNWFRHHFYNNLKIDYEHGSNKENHLHVEANLSYYHPTVMDVKVVRPEKTVYYNHIYMPSVFPHFEPPTVAEPFKVRFARKYFNYHAPMCFITGKYARTFDGLSYKLPLESCYHLAFGDSDWNSIYIYYRALDNAQHTKEALIYLNQGEEVVVKFSHVGGKIAVTVNDEQILHDGKDAYFHPKKGLAGIYKYADGYGFISKLLGVEFYYDGKNSVIAASNHYRGKQVGLCGNFDGELYNEFEGPDGVQRTDATTFAHSYQIAAPCPK